MLNTKRNTTDLRVGDKVKILNTGIFCGNTNNHVGVITIITKVVIKDFQINFKCQNGFYGYLHSPNKNSFWDYFELMNKQNNYEVYV